MNQRTAGICAAGLAAGAVVIRSGAPLLLDGGVLVAGVSADGAIGTITAVLLFPIVAALGYRAGTRRGLSQEHEFLIVNLALGGAIGSVGGLLLFESVRDGWTVPSGTGLELGVVFAVGTALYFALAGLTGLAVAAFRTGLPPTE